MASIFYNNVEYGGAGNEVHYGTTIPASSLGVSGDAYFRLDANGNLIEEYIKLGSNWTLVPKSDAVLGTKTITQNGTYSASTDSLDGYSSVDVNVSGGGSTLITKTITQNGTYDAQDDNADGFSRVIVNVSGGGGSNLFAPISYYNNNDSADNMTIPYENPFSSAITTSNFFLDLKAFEFSGSSTYTSSTVFDSYSNDELTLEWDTQSGSSRQYFGIVAIENTNSVQVLSGWTQYDTNAVNEFTIPASAQHLRADEFIIDFRNVVSGGTSINKSSITRAIVNDKLQITFPFPSTAGSVSLEARILYAV